MPLSENAYQYDVSIVIPVFNRRDLTERCLEAIARSSNHASYEVIVINNGSTDDTAQLLSSIEGDMTVITNKTNEGFAAACNRGARLATGRYLLLLNNDTEVSDDYLDNMLAAANAQDKCGAVGTKLLYANGRVQHAGIAFNQDGTPYHIFQNFAADHPAVTTSRMMQAVTAACMLVSREVYNQFGGFDSGYRNGFEDIDFCLRLTEQGYRNYYCADCDILHHEESSPGRKDNDRENLQRFNARWAATIIPDEERYLAEFNLRLVWGAQGGRYESLTGDQTGGNPDTPLDIASLLDRAQKKYLEGRHDDAATILHTIVERKMTFARDDEFETWQLLGNCMARLNRAAEAETAFIHAAEVNNESERPFLGLGSVALMQENWTAAQYGFLAALTRKPAAPRAEFGLGISLAARGRHNEALKHFQQVVAADARNSEAVFYLYRSALEVGQPDAAISALSSYLEQFPNDADFWFHLAGALWKNGSPDDAIEACERVLDLNPQHADAQSTLEYMESRVGATA
ncbi:MAG: glycosyltransferase [bacterium]|nr:glycosyltransferase [bacterium]